MRWSTTPFAPILLAAGALLLGAFTPLAAQNTGVIRGKVTEAGTGRPVPDARVTITGRQQGAVTSASGDYVIPSVPAGTAELLARRIGYGRSTRTVTVTAGAETRADFTISMTASVLDAVIVTGTGATPRSDRSATRSRSSTSRTSRRRRRCSNVTEVLQGKTPGVTILPGSGVPGTAGEIRIRGASSLSGYKPVVFIDGIRYNIDDLGGFAATGGGTAGLAQSSQVTSALNNPQPERHRVDRDHQGPRRRDAVWRRGGERRHPDHHEEGDARAAGDALELQGGDGQQRWKLLPPDNLKTCDAASKAATMSATDTTKVWPGCQDRARQHDHHRQPARPRPAGDPDRGPLRYSGNVRGGGDRYSFYVSGDRETEQGVFYNSDNNRTSIRTNFALQSERQAELRRERELAGWPAAPADPGRVGERPPAEQHARRCRRGSAGSARTTRAGARSRRPRRTATRTTRRVERFTLGGTATTTRSRWFLNRVTAAIDNTVTQAQLLFLPGDIDVAQDADAAWGANFRSHPDAPDPHARLRGDARSGIRRASIEIDDARSARRWSATTSESVRRAGHRHRRRGRDARRTCCERRPARKRTAENNSVGYYVQEQVDLNNRLFLTAAVRADDHSSFGTNFDI